MVTKVNLIDKLHTDLGNYLLCKRLILHANMDIYCSFKLFAGGIFGFSYREDRSCISQVVPLHSCKNDISSHLWSWKFSDPENEVGLILSLAGVSGFGPPPFADLDTPTKLSFQASFVSYLVTNSICKLFCRCSFQSQHNISSIKVKKTPAISFQFYRTIIASRTVYARIMMWTN